MAPRETENNAYAKFCGDKQGVLWYVMVFSGKIANFPRPKKIVLIFTLKGATLLLSLPK